jgi:hypothetical protein
VLWASVLPGLWLFLRLELWTPGPAGDYGTGQMAFLPARRLSLLPTRGVAGADDVPTATEQAKPESRQCWAAA